MRRLFLTVTFLTITPATLIVSLIMLGSISSPQRVLGISAKPDSYRLYTALPEELAQVNSTVVAADARPVIIQEYLAKYNSPLEPYADFIVEISDNYGLDFRLLVAIAQQESNLGKKAPEDSYNAWGWGVHSQGTLRFSGWEEGIETVAAGLKEKYIDQGLTTTEEIMAKYTPLSNGSWAFGVNQFIDELTYGLVE